MNARPSQIVVDAGGGGKCWFATYRDPAAAARIIAVDIDAEEMAANTDVDEKRVADVSKHLPFKDGEVDLVTSRSVLEHLRKTDAFMRETYRVLKPGGFAIHLFPSKYAPFSVLNRLLPQRLSSWLLHVLVPGSKGVLGYPAFYDRTYASGMRRLLAEAGFEIVDVRVDYYQANYFAFFFPLYMLNVAYEMFVRRLGQANLAATVLIVAQKPASDELSSPQPATTC